MGWSDSFLAVDLNMLLEREDYCKRVLKLSSRSGDYKERLLKVAAFSYLVQNANSVMNLLKQIKDKGVLELDEKAFISLKFFLLESVTPFLYPKVLSIGDGDEEIYMFTVVTALLENASKKAAKLWTELVKPNREKKCTQTIRYATKKHVKELPVKIEGNTMTRTFDLVSTPAEIKFAIKNAKDKAYDSYTIGFLCDEEAKILKDSFAEIIRNKSKFEKIGKNAARTNDLEEDLFLHYYYEGLYIETLFLMIKGIYGKPLLIFKRF